MNSPKHTVGQTLDFFRAQLGTTEHPSESNCQQYSHFWHAPCQPWCADCTCYVLQHCGVLDVQYSAYTPRLASNFKKAGRWGNEPRPGAVVFFDFIGRISHVGMVEAVRSDGSVVTLEGNTDAPGGRDGGRVMRHVRRSHIVGYGYPQYAAGQHPVRQPKRGEIPAWYYRVLKDVGNPRHYLQGPDVRHVQKAVGALPDGEYGPKTASRVRAWQVAHRVTPFDGQVGPITARAMG